MNTFFTRQRLILSFSIVLVGLGIAGCARSPEAKEARFLSRGKELMQKKEFPRATLEFLNAVKVMPRDAEAYYQLALAYLATNNFERAIAALRKATELNPKHVDAQVKLSSLMATSDKQGVLEEAQKRLSGALAVSPDNADVLDVLALTQFRLGKTEEAEQDLNRALEKFPAHLQSSVSLARLKLAQKDIPGAEEALQKAVKAAPNSADAALALSSLYLASGKVEPAVAEVKRALQIDPKKPQALMALAGIQVRTGKAAESEQTLKQLSQLPEKAYKPFYGAYLFHTGRRDAAVAEFVRLAKESPDDRAARSRLVAAYAAVGKTGEAEAILKQALDKNAKDTEALFQRSQLYVSTGKFAEAENDLRQVLRVQPDSAPSHYALARVYAARGATLNQRQELTEALRLNRNLLGARVELARLLIGTNAASTALGIMMETPDPQKNTLPAIVGRNWAYLALDNRKEARDGINAGLALSRAPELLLQDAVLKMAEKDYAGARTSSEEVLKVLPENLQAWQIFGQSLAAQKQAQKALERLQQAVAQQPKSAPLQLLLGRWLSGGAKAAEARAAFTAAKNLNPKLYEADMALAQLDFAEGKTDAARQRLTALITAQPQNAPARLLMGTIEEKAGNRAGAVAQYRALLEVDRNNPLALNNLAYLMLKDNPDEALKFAQQAGELAPDNAAVQDTLGWAYYRKGIYDTALRYLKTAVDKEGTARRKYHLAMAYFKVGDQELGRKTLKAALDMDPKLANAEQDF